MTHSRLLKAVPLIAVGLGVAGFARAEDCAVPLAAALKLDQVPYHMRMTDVDGTDKAVNGGSPTVSEVIATADKMYVNVDGKWRAIDKITHDDEDVQNEIKNSSCAYLRDEAVGGVDAAVYHVSDKPDEDTVIEETLWVAKDSGLVLRMDIDTDVGGGDVGKSHSSSLIDYADVSPPAGVQ